MEIVTIQNFVMIILFLNRDNMTKRNIQENVWKFINKKDEDECWEYEGSLDSYQYGQIRINGKMCLVSLIFVSIVVVLL